MSISAIQQRRKTKEFTKQLLQKGIEPNNYELNKMLTEYFDGHTLGMPYYSPIKQIPYEESSKEDYNHNFKTFKEDIETAYEANIEANNRAVAMQEYYEVERNKVRNAIARLALRVENVNEALKTNSQIKQYVQSFDDLYDVELYGDTSRNIPYTTAFIDLLQKKVYTDKSFAKMNKMLLTNASISISKLNSFDSYETKGEIEKVLTDTISDTFIISGKSTQENKKSIEINVDLGKTYLFNTVCFSFTSVKMAHCQLLLSSDGENFIPVYDYSNRDYIEWSFNTKEARYLRIIYTKTEPDGIEKDDQNNEFFRYHYFLKNISIANEEYESQSVFVSKVIDFDDLTSTIKLDATDMIFNNTRIDYFIGFDNEKDKIGWDAIKNHKDHELFMFQKRHKIINLNTEEFGSQDGYLKDLYMLYKLPENINRNSIKVTPAYNMWSVKKYNRLEGDHDDGFSLMSSDYTELVNKCEETQLFMDCENYSNFDLECNVLYIFTQYISLEESKNLYDIFINVTNVDCNKIDEQAEKRIFLNGIEISGDVNSRYSFALKKGVNKIQMAIYIPSNIVIPRRLHHNLNFKQLTNNVFGFTPMKYTNNFVLDKMENDSYTYYTIRNNTIYVKCNPKDLIRSSFEDMGYFITYSCLREDMIGYFKDNHIKFRIMAVLSSTDKNLSPALINFRITGK